MDKLHTEILERVEYLVLNHKDLEIDDKKLQLKMIFESMSQQQDIDLLVQEIAAISYYSLHDKDCILHLNVQLKPKKGA